MHLAYIWIELGLPDPWNIRNKHKIINVARRPYNYTNIYLRGHFDPQMRKT